MATFLLQWWKRPHGPQNLNYLIWSFIEKVHQLHYCHNDFKKYKSVHTASKLKDFCGYVWWWGTQLQVPVHSDHTEWTLALEGALRINVNTILLCLRSMFYIAWPSSEQFLVTLPGSVQTSSLPCSLPWLLQVRTSSHTFISTAL